MRDLLLRAQERLRAIGHAVGLDDGIGHRPVYTRPSPELPDGMESLGTVEQLHVREPGEKQATILTFDAGELKAYLETDPTKPGRKLLQLVGQIGADRLMIRTEKDPALIGPVHRIVYRDANAKLWEHAFGYEFGSDGSELPILFWRVADRRLFLVGGVYWVGLAMGIVC